MMKQQQEITQVLLATPVKGFVAKRFFHVTAPERHVDNIAARLEPDEKFYSFILLPNSKKQTVEALICTNRRIIVWHNEFDDDEDILLSEIESTQMEKGWFSSTLHLFKAGVRDQAFRKFKCETEIISAFQAAVLEAKRQA